MIYQHLLIYTSNLFFQHFIPSTISEVWRLVWRCKFLSSNLVKWQHTADDDDQRNNLNFWKVLMMYLEISMFYGRKFSTFLIRIIKWTCLMNMLIQKWFYWKRVLYQYLDELIDHKRKKDHVPKSEDFTVSAIGNKKGRMTSKRW